MTPLELCVSEYRSETRYLKSKLRELIVFLLFVCFLENLLILKCSHCMFTAVFPSLFLLATLSKSWGLCCCILCFT